MIDSNDKLHMELSAYRAFEAFGPSLQLDRVMRGYGLTTTTTLASMSQEALGEWIKEKTDKVWHAILIKANEVHAYVTNAEPEIKKKIAEAKARGPGHNMVLPVDGERLVRMAGYATAILAACAVLKGAHVGLKKTSQATKTLADVQRHTDGALDAGVEMNKVQEALSELTEISGKFNRGEKLDMSAKQFMDAYKDAGAKLKKLREEAEKL